MYERMLCGTAKPHEKGISSKKYVLKKESRKEKNIHITIYETWHRRERKIKEGTYELLL